jgi:hypothetical protein
VVTLNASANILATSSNSYSTPAVPFCTTGPSFFVPGLNVLTVTVKNLGGRTGMAMVAKLEAICGPDCVCGCPEGTVLVDGTCVPTNPIDLRVDKENTPGGGGGTWFNVWVTNVGPPITFPAGAITIDEVIPTGMTVSSVTGTGWTCVPLSMVGPGTMHCTYNLAGSLGTGVSLSSTMVVHYTTTGPGPFINCAIVGVGSSVGVDTNPSNDKACVEVTGTPVDVGIVKTGATTPWCPAPFYVFTITVTNGPNPWPGTGNIVVTDTVPANMTFGPIPPPPPWSCPAGIIPAGTTFTCTYVGPPLAANANQVLPPIVIPATPTVGPPFPPYVNCASVAITPSSGYTDTNPANNNFCTPPVLKPAVCCQPPAFMNAEGICTCPPPQVLDIVAGICVNPPPICPSPQVPNVDGICACPAPMQPGAVPGQCLCPNGTAPVGGACVTPPPLCPPPQQMIPGVGCKCPLPMVTGATPDTCLCPTGTALVNGACVPVDICPPGTVRKGRECVKVEIVCKSPLVPNAAGTDCVRKPTEKKKTRAAPECPKGQEMVRGKCRVPERKSQDTDRIPRIDLRGLGGFGGGGGRRQGGGGTGGGGGGPVR